MKKIIVVGAASGIGLELARQYSELGCELGLLDIDLEKLRAATTSFQRSCRIAQIDCRSAEGAREILNSMLSEFKQVDLVVVTAGVGKTNPSLDWEIENQIISVNVTGFVAVILCAFEHFKKQGYGQIAAVSSIARVRGIPEFPAYSASKAFVSNYLEALRIKAAKLKLPVVVTDLCAGYIETPLLGNVTGGAQTFWVSSVSSAVAKMRRAIQLKRSFAYIPGRWRFVAWLFKILPERVLALLPG